jgi:hypothetical protein
MECAFPPGQRYQPSIDEFLARLAHRAATESRSGGKRRHILPALTAVSCHTFEIDIQPSSRQGKATPHNATNDRIWDLGAILVQCPFVGYFLSLFTHGCPPPALACLKYSGIYRRILAANTGDVLFSKVIPFALPMLISKPGM